LVKFGAEFLILVRIARISPRPAENENTGQKGDLNFPSHGVSTTGRILDAA